MTGSRHWATRGLGFYEMKPIGCKPEDAIVTPNPQVAQMVAQEKDWVLQVSASISDILDPDEIHQIVDSTLAKCSPSQNNTVIKDLIKSSITKGAAGTCTAALHVIGSRLHYGRSVEHVETLNTGAWGSAEADRGHYNP